MFENVDELLLYIPYISIWALVVGRLVGMRGTRENFSIQQNIGCLSIDIKLSN